MNSKSQKVVFKINNKKFMVFALIALLGASGCKKKDDNPTDTTANNKVLVIKNGAQSTLPDKSITYSATLVDIDGNITTPTGVTWSTSNSDVATVNASGVLSIASVGNVNITASVTIDGSTLTASVPLRIQTPILFAVAPSAIIYEKGGQLQLETVYFSANGTVPTYTYSSSNSGVASVSNSGLIEFVEAGECEITVTANLDGNPQFVVPVLVITAPEVVLPVTRVEVNPPSKDLFKNETQQLTAVPYNGNNEQVTGKSIIWSSLNTAVATVDNNGLVTPVRTGSTYIQATVEGIIGQAEIIVNPDTLVVVDPMYASVSAGNTQQFTASAYHITRTTVTSYTGITFNWMIPTYGFSMFDIATIDQNGLATVKSDAMAGMMTMVVAYDQNNIYVGGGAGLSVAVAGSCDCGTGNAAVNQIVVSNGSTINMTVMDPPVQLNVTANDINGNPVTNPQLVFCSDNIMVANVSSTGEITASGVGTAIIKICSGQYAETTVTVNVSY